MNDTSTLPQPTQLPPPASPAPSPVPERPSRGVRLAWFTPGAILAIAALGWGTYNILSLLAHSEYTSTDTFAASDVASLDMWNENGSMTVNPTDGDEITVVAEVSNGWRSTEVSSRIVGNQLVVRGGCPTFVSPWCWVDFTVEIPADRPMTVTGSNGSVDIRGATGSLDVTTDNGSIDLVDVSGNVRASSDNGRITGRGMTSAVVDTATDNGRIELSFLDPPQTVSARTSNGRIEVIVPDDDVLYRVDLRTSNGSTDNLVRTDPASDHVIELSTDNGSITLRPPS